MRLERGPFWRLLAVNLLVAAVAWLLLPAGFGVPWPGMEGTPLPPIPLKPIIAYLICVPVGWLGARRLHDIGRAGWHAWLPLVAFACITFIPSLMLPLLLKLVIEAQAAPLQTRDIAPKIMIGLWLAALLLAAGSLRTVFLWLEPSDPQDNRYGPAPARASAASQSSAPAFVLGGRMRRLPFWLLLAANVAFVRGASYVLTHWPQTAVPDAHILSLLNVVFYLPSFAAAVLRLHDRNQTGLLSALALALSVAATLAENILDVSQRNLANGAADIITIYLLFQCLQPGDANENRFGPPPGEQPPHAPEPAILQTSPSPPRQAQTVARAAIRQGFGRRGL